MQIPESAAMLVGIESPGFHVPPAPPTIQPRKSGVPLLPSHNFQPAGMSTIAPDHIVIMFCIREPKKSVDNHKSLRYFRRQGHETHVAERGNAKKMRDFRIFKHCRWCEKRYFRHQPHGRDGFCCAAHKQAHYRAYKKYVTGYTGQRKDPRSDRKKR